MSYMQKSNTKTYYVDLLTSNMPVMWYKNLIN